jgi:hypothetical protein
MTTKKTIKKTTKKPIKKFIPLTHWPQYHPYPNISGLRYLVFNAEKNGFASCIKRIGKRILIDEDAFFAWVDNQQYNQSGV